MEQKYNSKNSCEYCVLWECNRIDINCNYTKESKVYCDIYDLLRENQELKKKLKIKENWLYKRRLLTKNLIRNLKNARESNIQLGDWYVLRGLAMNELYDEKDRYKKALKKIANKAKQALHENK